MQEELKLNKDRRKWKVLTKIEKKKIRKRIRKWLGESGREGKVFKKW